MTTFAMLKTDNGLIELMEKNAKFFRDAAWEQLKGRWEHAVLFTLVYILIIGAVEGIGLKSNFASVLSFLVIYPLYYGYGVAFLGYKRTGVNVEIKEMFDGFKDFGRVFLTCLLEYVYIVLWTLLLFVPGIIKACAYSQTYYILKDNPELKNNAVIERSMAMMDGHKMEYFRLILSFIGWYLLAILTLGIGLLWITPYTALATAHFYEYVKEDYERRIAA